MYARVHHAIPESLKKGGSQGGAPHPAEVSAQAAPAGGRRRGGTNFRFFGQNRTEHYGLLWAAMAVMTSIPEVSQKVSRMAPGVQI